MKPYQHLLVAVDLTTESHETLKKAKKIADTFEAKISVVSALEPIPFYGFGYVDVHGLEKQLLDSANAKLQKLATEFKIAPENQYLNVGFPKQFILEICKRLQPDLIVMGSQTKGNLLTRLGSTADYVLHHSHCDVFIVRHEIAG
jgi:universal stress protein A